MKDYNMYLADAYQKVDIETREAFHASYRWRWQSGARAESVGVEYSIVSLQGAFNRVLCAYRESVVLASPAREAIPSVIAVVIRDAFQSLPPFHVNPFFRILRDRAPNWTADPAILTDRLKHSLRHYVLTKEDLDVVS